MKINPIKMDRLLDRIPVLSSLSNIVALFLKYVVLPKMKEEVIKKSHYFTYLKEKNLDRMIFLTIVPIISNIVYAILDCSNKKVKAVVKVKNEIKIKEGISDKEFILEFIKRDKGSLQQQVIRYLSNEYGVTPDYTKVKDDREVALTLFKETQPGRKALFLFSERLRNDEELVKERLKINPSEIEFAGDIPKNSRKLALDLVEKNVYLLQYFSKEVRDDDEVILAAMKKSAGAIQFASERLREILWDREEIFRKAVNENERVIMFASPRIRNLPEFQNLAAQHPAHNYPA